MNSEVDEVKVEKKDWTELYKAMYERIKEDLKSEMRLTKRNIGHKAEELDRKNTRDLFLNTRNSRRTTASISDSILQQI